MTMSASELRQIIREELTAVLHPSVRVSLATLPATEADQRAEACITENPNGPLRDHPNGR